MASDYRLHPHDRGSIYVGAAAQYRGRRFLMINELSELVNSDECRE
jgi:hypothetical protein